MRVTKVEDFSLQSQNSFSVKKTTKKQVGMLLQEEICTFLHPVTQIKHSGAFLAKICHTMQNMDIDALSQGLAPPSLSTFLSPPFEKCR